MEQYKLKHGYHFSGGKQYGAGDIVKSKNNLAKLFPDRFVVARVNDVAPPVLADIETVAPPLVLDAETPDEELDLEEEAVEAPVVAPKKPRGRPKVTRKAPEDQ